MKKQLHDYRKSYKKGSLSQRSVTEDPMQQFEKWLLEAQESGEVDEVNAMTLSTSNENGLPKGRIVLLKEYNEDGFIFYTNYGSEKGIAIAQNNQVGLSFFWPSLERQIIIQGTATKVSKEQSQSYFSQRPRKSQLGALVSDQSVTIDSRVTLEQRLEALEKQYEGGDIPMPTNWGGYLVAPSTYEFWQGRRSRLHDRIKYTKENDLWVTHRLQP